MRISDWSSDVCSSDLTSSATSCTPSSIPASTSRAGRSDMSEAIQAGRFLGMRISPLNRRRLHNFRANQRGFWSLWIFLVLFILSLLAEFIAKDRPFLVYYDGDFYVPILRDYPETAFGGPFPTAEIGRAHV